MHQEGLLSIHDRSLIDSEFRASQLEHDRDEKVCIKMDDLADKEFSQYMTESENFLHKQSWWTSLNKSGTAEPRRGRSDFNDALSTLNRLRQESGERQRRPVPFWKYQQWHQSSSSSSTWWQWSDSWWSSQQFSESRQMRMHAKRYDRTVKPVVYRLWRKPQTSDFHDFLNVLFFVKIGSYRVDGRLLQPTVSAKTAPQKTRFRDVNLYKEFAYRSKIE